MKFSGNHTKLYFLLKLLYQNEKKNQEDKNKNRRAIAKNGSPFSTIQIAAYSAVEALPEHLTRFPPAVHASRRFAAQQPDLPD